jgi:hypothetical protein
MAAHGRRGHGVVRAMVLTQPQHLESQPVGELDPLDQLVQAFRYTF